MPGFPDRQSSTIFNKLRHSKTALSLAIAGAAFGLASCAKGVEAQPAPAPSVLQSAEQVPSASPSASEATPSAPETTSTEKVTLRTLDNQTYHEFMEKLNSDPDMSSSEYDKRYETLEALVYGRVDIDLDKWDKLSDKEKARRAELYLQVTLENSSRDIGDPDDDTGEDGPKRLEEIGYSPIIDQKTVDQLNTAKASDGSITEEGYKALRKIETIRRAAEEATGYAFTYDEDGEVTASDNVRENLSDYLMPLAGTDDPRTKETFSSTDQTYFDTDKSPSLSMSTVDDQPYLSYVINDGMRLSGEYAEGGSSIKVLFMKTGDGTYLPKFGWNIVY